MSDRHRAPASPRPRDGDAPSRRQPAARARRAADRLRTACSVLLTLLFVSPLLFMLSTSFKTTGDAASPDPRAGSRPTRHHGRPSTTILGNDGHPGRCGGS